MLYTKFQISPHFMFHISDINQITKKQNSKKPCLKKIKSLCHICPCILTSCQSGSSNYSSTSTPTTFMLQHYHELNRIQMNFINTTKDLKNGQDDDLRLFDQNESVYRFALRRNVIYLNNNEMGLSQRTQSSVVHQNNVAETK